MPNVLGRRFKTLNYYVEKDIKETIYKNAAFKANKWRFFESQIVHWSQRHLFYVSLLFVFFVLLTVNLLLWQTELKTLISPLIVDWRPLTGWQQTFLSVQLTIVAVIYPLVVGLIGVLLQNTAGSKTILPIYQKYSGFMFSGLSGLVLPLFILLGYLSKSWLSDANYLAVCLSTAVWLSVNILLTSWFFAKTFSILDSTKRDELVIRYSINELCVKDIKLRLKENFIQNASYKQLISSPKKSILIIESYNYLDDGYDVITASVDKHKSLYDVRFWLLNFAIILQTLLLFLCNKKQEKLVFQPYRSSRGSNEFQICKASFKPNLLVELLIRTSLIYRVVDSNTDENFKAMTDGLLGSVIDSINNDNTHTFEVAIENLIEWHTEISSSLAFVNDYSEKDNWLLLPSSGLFDRSYLNELNTEYYQLSRLASEKITTNTRYFQKMLTLHKSINSFGNDLTVSETLLLIEGNYLQWRILVEWYSAHLNKADMRLTNKYEDILYTFVGAWEAWLISIEYKYRREGDMKNAYPSLVCHLGFSAQTIISALRFKNEEATDWAIDILNNWINKFSDKEYYHQEYEWSVELLTTTQLLILDKRDQSWTNILNDDDYQHVPAFELAFKNLALDLRLLTACYILLKPKSNQEEKLKLQVTTLLSGHNKESHSSSSTLISRPGEVLGAYIRHCDYINSNQNRSYKNYLSSVIEQFEKMDTVRMVSGRSYLSWGGVDSPSRMNSSYIEIVLSMSSSVWSLSGRWNKIIVSEAFPQTAREALIQELHCWNTTVDTIEGSILFETDKLDKLKDNFKTSISKIITQIQEHNNSLLENAKIDDDKLSGLAIAASTPFLEIVNPKYPFSLFNRVNNRSSNAVEYIFTISNFEKERIAEGIDAIPILNEESWLAEGIRNQVNSNLYQRVIEQQPQKVEICKSIEVTLAQIRRSVLDFDKPILFVSYRNFETILRQYSCDVDKSSQYELEYRDGFGGEYICHIKKCPVYRLRLEGGKQCIMTSKNLFKQLSFVAVDAKKRQFIKPSFTASDNKIEGILALSYSMAIELSDDDCIKLELSFSNDEC